jgi:RNA polymerase sigma-70 factor (ECF subfamily)
LKAAVDQRVHIIWSSILTFSTPSIKALFAHDGKVDSLAFDNIVLRYKNQVYHYILRMTGNVEEAQDLTQDVFIRSYVALDSFRSQSSLTTWIMRIAANICIDAHRKKTRKDLALGGPATSLEEHTGGGKGDITADSANIFGVTRDCDPFEAIAADELDSCVQKALERLPDKMRSAIVLHDINGLTYQEIAAIQYCPVGTVKSRLFNARLHLRELLQDYVQY